eukprot:s2590_g2.t1
MHPENRRVHQRPPLGFPRKLRQAYDSAVKISLRCAWKCHMLTVAKMTPTSSNMAENRQCKVLPFPESEGWPKKNGPT